MSKIENWEICLTKLTGKKIKEITGHASDEFGEPTFKLFRIVFDDDSMIFVEGEHDMPYLSGGDNQPGLDEESLEKLMEKDDE